MKKFILAVLFMFGFAVSAQAWTVTEDASYYPDDDWMNVDVTVINDSSEDVVAIAVGMTANLWDGDINFRPHWSNPWFAHAVSCESWSVDFNYAPGYDVNYADYFGLSWYEAFGNDYEWAFVTTTLLDGDDPLATGATSIGMGYGYGDDTSPMSPVVAMFNSGSLTGETGFSNPNPGNTAPVPEPGTMLLFGTGLAGLIGLQRKRMNK